jgi:hypothetical protein
MFTASPAFHFLALITHPPFADPSARLHGFGISHPGSDMIEAYFLQWPYLGRAKSPIGVLSALENPSLTRCDRSHRRQIFRTNSQVPVLQLTDRRRYCLLPRPTLPTRPLLIRVCPRFFEAGRPSILTQRLFPQLNKNMGKQVCQVSEARILMSMISSYSSGLWQLCERFLSSAFCSALQRELALPFCRQAVQARPRRDSYHWSQPGLFERRLPPRLSLRLSGLRLQP